MDCWKKLTPVLLFIVFLLGEAFGSGKWTSKLTFNDIVTNAKNADPYYMGLLGIYLRSGEAGCSVNLEAARKWSEAALRKGHPFGSYNLANMAMLGGDFAEATRLYQDAAFLLERKASEGDAVALYCMGEIDFQVIPTNVRRALALFQESADAGYPQAQATIGALYLKGLPGLLERDPKKGVELLFNAVRKNSLTARFNLGMAYYNGDGVRQDTAKAFQWLQVAERQNFAEAQYFLGMLLAEGADGVPKDIKSAQQLLQKASMQSHKLAEKYLKDMQATTELPSAKIPEPPSSDNLTFQPKPDNQEILLEARKYYTGIGKPKNYGTAYKMLFPLAKAGNAEASRYIGLMKLTGKGTEKNPKEAKEWLSAAAQNGDDHARRMLDQYRSLF
jgi:TPR repeat protein